MRLLKNYNQLLLESTILYLSPNFRLKLQSVKNTIAQDLLDIELSDIKPDMTFLNLEKDGMISFIQIDTAQKKIFKNLGDFLDMKQGIYRAGKKDQPVGKNWSDYLYRNDMKNRGLSTGVFTKSRNKIKPGKLINKIFKGKYSDSEIEKFVNLLKSKSHHKNFELISGNSLEAAFNCTKIPLGSGTLNKSCMNNKHIKSEPGDIFNIYTQNSEVCQILILKDPNDPKYIIGRALIWKVSNQDYDYYMDRIYTVNDSDIYSFRNYALEQGWAFREFNSYDDNESINYQGVVKNTKLEVRVNSGDYNNYPYMDTFCYYHIETGTLSNQPIRNMGVIYLLTDDQGGISEIF